MKPKLIGLTGLRGSGKDSVADILGHSDGYTNVKLAAPLKEMIATLMYYQGASIKETVEAIEGEKKNIPNKYMGGATPRWAMQSLGTEWGRLLMRNSFWVDICRNRIWSEQVERGIETPIVISDVRFLNEAEMITMEGGEIWRIVRLGLEAEDHESEQEQARIKANRVIKNDGTLQDLAHKVYAILEEPSLLLI